MARSNWTLGRAPAPRCGSTADGMGGGSAVVEAGNWRSAPLEFCESTTSHLGASAY